MTIESVEGNQDYHIAIERLDLPKPLKDGAILACSLLAEGDYEKARDGVQVYLKEQGWGVVVIKGSPTRENKAWFNRDPNEKKIFIDGLVFNKLPSHTTFELIHEFNFGSTYFEAKESDNPPPLC